MRRVIVSVCMLAVFVFCFTGMAAADPEGSCAHEWENGVCTICGTQQTSNVEYAVSDTGILTLSGTGSTADYDDVSELPWYNSLYAINRVIIREGVTRIGDHVLDGLRGLVRVDLCQTVKPEISENAIGESNVRIRYYSTDSSWDGSGDDGWIYLPLDEPLDDSYDKVSYDETGWYVEASLSYEPYYIKYDNLSAAQAAEMSYRIQNMTLYALPPESELWTVFTSGGATFITGTDGEYTVTVPDERACDFSIVDPNLKLTINDTENKGKYFGLTVNSGNITYNGNLRSLYLNRSEDDPETTVIITGNLGNLTANENSYSIDVQVGGSIEGGSIYGVRTMTLPEISVPLPLGNSLLKTIPEQEVQGLLIDDGVLKVETEGDDGSANYEDYKLEYRYIEGKWNLSAEPIGNGSFANVADIQQYDAAFDETKIHWSPTTRLTVNTDNLQGEPLVIDGRTNRPETEEVDLSHVTIYRGNVTLNCPVGSVNVPERRYGSNEPITITINNSVEEISFSLLDTESRILLGAGARVGGGTWNRPFGYNRSFGAVNGPESGTRALFEGCTLNELSSKDNQTLKAKLPTEAEIKDGLGELGENDRVMMDVTQAETDDTDTAALQAIGINEDAIATAFDISVISYTVAVDGTTEEGEAQTELDNAVPIEVSDPAAGDDPDVYVVRLHDNTAEPLDTTYSNGAYQFESDRFSKYFLVTNAEEIDPDTLDTLDLPQDLTRIEAHAFENGDFEAVFIPDDCTYIGEYAFKDCKKLIYVSYPKGITIEDNTFEGCTIRKRVER